MNQQTPETVNYLLGDAHDEQDVFEFADLNPTDEELDGIKGGGTWPPSGGGLNHNETVTEDAVAGTESLADLTVGDAELIKGGDSQGTGKTLTAALLGK